MTRSGKVTVVPFARTPRAGAIPLANLVIAGLALGITVVAGKRMFGNNENPDMPNLSGVSRVVAGSDTAPQQAPTAEQALGAFRVRNLAGKSEPLVTKGQPVILMVSSRTCTWCKRALKDLGELSAGRPLPRLKVITLEGAAEGVAMLAKEGITGAQLVGPVGGADQVLLTFRYPGTPTFVAIDRNGRVVKTLPGYPIREEMKHWYAVMVGDQDVP